MTGRRTHAILPSSILSLGAFQHRRTLFRAHPTRSVHHIEANKILQSVTLSRARRYSVSDRRPSQSTVSFFSLSQFGASGRSWKAAVEVVTGLSRAIPSTYACCGVAPSVRRWEFQMTIFGCTVSDKPKSHPRSKLSQNALPASYPSAMADSVTQSSGAW